MLSSYKSFHSIRILFTILLLLVQFCLVFCPDPNPILPDLNEPYIEPGFDEHHAGPSFTEPYVEPGFNVKHYIEQVLKINPETLEEEHKKLWLKRPSSDEFLQGDETLTTYAISKFHEAYPAADYQLKSKVLDGGTISSRFKWISGDKTLYLLSNSEIPIYFTIGAQPALPTSGSIPRQVSFWMFEKYFSLNSAAIGLEKHLIGVASIGKGIEKKKALLNQLEKTDDNLRFQIPKSGYTNTKTM